VAVASAGTYASLHLADTLEVEPCKMFVTVASLKYTVSVSKLMVSLFRRFLIQICSNNIITLHSLTMHSKPCYPYPQYGGPIVAIDTVMSHHPMYKTRHKSLALLTIQLLLADNYHTAQRRNTTLYKHTAGPDADMN